MIGEYHEIVKVIDERREQTEPITAFTSDLIKG